MSMPKKNHYTFENLDSQKVLILQINEHIVRKISTHNVINQITVIMKQKEVLKFYEIYDKVFKN